MARLTYAETLKRKAQKEAMECIPAMSKEAQNGNVQAFQGLLKAGGIGESGGIRINNNVVGAVDARRLGDTEADWKFFQKFRGKLETSLLRDALPRADEGDDTRAVQAESKLIQGQEK